MLSCFYQDKECRTYLPNDRSAEEITLNNIVRSCRWRRSLKMSCLCLLPLIMHVDISSCRGAGLWTTCDGTQWENVGRHGTRDTIGCDDVRRGS